MKFNLKLKSLKLTKKGVAKYFLYKKNTAYMIRIKWDYDPPQTA